METKDVEQIAQKIYDNFVNEISILKTDIVNMISHQFDGINKSLCDYNEKFEKQQSILNTHTEKLEKHDKILENHMQIITNVSKDVHEIKGSSLPSRKKMKTWTKIAIVSGISYLVGNSIILIMTLIRLLKW